MSSGTLPCCSSPAQSYFFNTQCGREAASRRRGRAESGGHWDGFRAHNERCNSTNFLFNKSLECIYPRSSFLICHEFGVRKNVAGVRSSITDLNTNRPLNFFKKNSRNLKYEPYTQNATMLYNACVVAGTFKKQSHGMVPPETLCHVRAPPTAAATAKRRPTYNA